VVPDGVRDRLAAARSVLLTSHANPDGDAIGSELGLARALAASGRRVAIWNLHATPGLYAALPGAAAIQVGEEPPEGFPDGFDLVVVLECPTLERTGLAARLAGLEIVNVDHHLGNAGYGAASWVDPEAAAVAVMVAELAQAIGAPLDREAASCLLLGLVSDTGGFRFSNATPDAFRAAARLVESGARVERVSLWVYESQPEAAVRLLGELLATLVRHRGGRIATVHLTTEMFRRAGAGAGDSEGLIDVPRSIAGVDAVALFRELAPGSWKVSLRSRGRVDVETIARRHAGGGHRNAAGCRFEGTLEAATRAFVDELGAAVEDAS
jgi:phosphoesterase RecJ-like protein